MAGKIMAFLTILLLHACASAPKTVAPPSLQWKRFMSEWPGIPASDVGILRGYEEGEDLPGNVCTSTPPGVTAGPGKHACMCVFEDDYLKLKNYMYRSSK